METIPPSHPWEADSRFRMIDVGAKAITTRRAVAQGRVRLSREAFNAIRDKQNPKGDVLALAEAAGLVMAKKTAEIIPLCHPLPLDAVRMGFTLEESTATVLVICEARATAKTGVEMEAIAGVQGALLTIYDLSKAVNPEITLGEIRLNLKEGGKSGLWIHPEAREFYEASQQASPKTLQQTSPPPPAHADEVLAQKTLHGIRAAVITISDRCARGEADDKSGVVLVNGLKQQGAELIAHLTVPDEKAQIQLAVHNLVHEAKAQLIVTTGGTGFSPRDVTPEALEELYSRRVPGFGELLRAEGAKQTRMSWISRGEAGLIESTLVIPLPGSLNAATTGLETLRGLLPHAMRHLLKDAAGNYPSPNASDSK